MQRAAATVQPTLVRASSDHYGIPHCAGPSATPELVEYKKTMVVPVAGRAPEGARLAKQVPSPVAVQSPMATPQQTPHHAPAPKIQPALHTLPRFRPPVFEDACGTLPLPDSPGSTPKSGHEDREQERNPQERTSRVNERASHKRPTVHHNEPEPEQLVAEPTQRCPVGSVVEYKSRTSGLWILARVQAYDESTRTYRLDVQPHAHPDRVRPHRSRKLEADENQATGPKTEHSAAEHVQTQAKDDALYKNGAGKHALRRTPTALSEQSITSQQQSHGQTSRVPSAQEFSHVEGNARNIKQDEYNLSAFDVKQLILETLALREQVAHMRVEINTLQDSVTQEAAMKDRYFAELCLCREQLQQVCGTPM